MTQAALAEPQAIRISSKRQITIPAKMYKKKGFSEYAWIEETEEGLLIKPVPVEDEDVSLYVLRRLVEEGFEGEELIERYKEACPRVVKFHELLNRAENEVLQGDFAPFDEMQTRLRSRYGL